MGGYAPLTSPGKSLVASRGWRAGQSCAIGWLIQKPAAFLTMPAECISATVRQRRPPCSAGLPNFPVRCLSNAAVELKTSLHPGHSLRSPRSVTEGFRVVMGFMRGSYSTGYHGSWASQGSSSPSSGSGSVAVMQLELAFGMAQQVGGEPLRMIGAVQIGDLVRRNFDSIRRGLSQAPDSESEFVMVMT